MLAPLKKSYDKSRQHIKSRDITLLTTVHLVKTMVFPIVRCGCESWTIRKAKSQKTDVFKLWGWKRLLRVPWTVRRSNQSILKEINPEYSLEGLMLKLQYFGHLTWRANALEKAVMLEKIEREEKGRTEDEIVGWHHQLNGHEFEQAPGDDEGQWSLAYCSPWGPRTPVTEEQKLCMILGKSLHLPDSFRILKMERRK